MEEFLARNYGKKSPEILGFANFDADIFEEITGINTSNKTHDLNVDVIGFIHNNAENTICVTLQKNTEIKIERDGIVYTIKIQ